MNKSSKQIILVVFLIFPLYTGAQKTDQTQNIEGILESIIENLDDESGVSLIVEDLEDLAENPLNINSVSAFDLSKLHILNEIQIHKFLDYQLEFGPIYSIFELNTIDGFSPELLLKIEPFIWFGPVETEPKNFSETLKYGRHQLIIRSLGTVQIPKGYKEKEDGTIPYEGNRFRYYSRYRFQSGDKFSLGFTAEKDPGEAFFVGSNKKGFDFYSGHLSVKINSIFEKITVGDYIVRSGQGLVLWQGFSMSKSVNSMGIIKTNQGVRPFTSTDENKFFRGVSSSLNFGNVKVNLFYSSKNDDGNIVFSDSVATHFSSLQTSGYHRTISEIGDKKKVSQKNMGTVATLRMNNLKIGATFIYQQFNLPFKRSDQLYNRFRFSGTENYTAGADYLFSKGKYQLFGEAAFSKSKGKAFLQGSVAHLNDCVAFSVLFRHFDKNYQALWANSFSESSSVQNESGLYFGTQILPMKFVTLSAYSDFYSSEWINSNTAGPSKGWDFFAQADFRFSEKLQLYIRYKNEEKEQKIKGNILYENNPEQTRKARFHFQYKPSETLTFKTRFENAFFKGVEKENGYLVFQDVQFSPVAFPINISTRVAWFFTESYNSRIYAYENDLLYTFSIPAFSGNGFRGYLNLKYSLGEKLDFWFKVGHTLYKDRETISSGYNEIIGKNITEVKFQFRLKF